MHDAGCSSWRRVEFNEFWIIAEQWPGKAHLHLKTAPPSTIPEYQKNDDRYLDILQLILPPWTKNYIAWFMMCLLFTLYIYIYSFILNNNKIHPIQSRHIHHPVFGCYTVCPAHQVVEVASDAAKVHLWDVRWCTVSSWSHVDPSALDLMAQDFHVDAKTQTGRHGPGGCGNGDEKLLEWCRVEIFRA